ncbi:hypothetical protein [Olleya sp. UBA1516]|uniref:hypothetical protein n=1 Tax=Olleya sp. UBA1516 TaxID=1947013 RepID=UPI0025EA4C39|nr:hypothetical protein [Olleya sp. UBA1516]|tara:strand:+ start:10765 stop:11019 length:255 start_codon:yes stop_codon:yes gene_type:complete
MNFESIIELFKELFEAKKNQQLNWSLTGKTRYETNWNGKEIIIDRRNNIDKNTQEIYLEIDDFNKSYLPESEEFNFLAKIIDAI